MSTMPSLPLQTPVITGIGIVSPLGNTMHAVYEHLSAGKSASLSWLSIPHGAKLPVYRVSEKTRYDKKRLYDPSVRFALAATYAALEDAHLLGEKSAALGMIMSSSKGGVVTLENMLPLSGPLSRWQACRLGTALDPSCVSRIAARTFHVTGPVKSRVAACATGLHTIMEAARMVCDAEVDICIAGASDASLTPLMISGYHRMGVYSSRGIFPFDALRDGFVAGEGAGVVVVESLRSALNRGVPYYAALEAWQYGQETGHTLAYDPHQHALRDTIERLFARTGNDIDYINMHGTGTPSGDIYETEEMKAALKERAHTIPCSSTKSSMGHLLGAAGIVEMIVCIMSMYYNFIPPTVGLRQADPLCDLDYTPQVRRHAVQRAWTISMGFGGHIGIVSLMKGTR